MLATCRTPTLLRLLRQVRIFLAASLLLPAAFGHAQSTSPCTAADLDTTFRFANYAPSTHIVIAFSRNISTHECSLRGHTAPTFYTFNQAAPLTIPICLNCDHPADNPPLTLRPDDVAHETIRWSTLPSAGAPACQKPSVMNLPTNDDSRHPAQLISPSLLSPICSQVALDTYSIGPAFGDDDSQPMHALTGSIPRLASYRLNYFAGEFFSLHAESGAPANGPLALRGARCPVSLLRQRTADGSTRFEEIIAPQIRCSREYNPDPDQPYFTTTFDSVAPVRNIAGDTSMQLLQLTGNLSDPLLRLAESNSITLHVADPFLPTRAGSFTPNAPNTDSENLTANTGWQSNFSLVDTSFGKQSVLIDQTTHLEWLPLSATRNRSQDDIRHLMAPRKAFDGWRFATDEEVATFFRHFTNSPTGRSNDPSIERALQRLMGGPLASPKNNADGAKRSFTNGRIAGYYAHTFDFAPAGAPRFQYHYAYIGEEHRDDNVTATIDPHRTGSIDGDRTSPDTGTFLVREH